MSSLTSMHEWVKAARAGEEIAWNVLYRQYYPGAYAIALRICGNTPVARDAVQDAFMMAYLKLTQLKDVAAFGGWIKKIVMHNCYRALHYRWPAESSGRIPLETDSWWEDEINRKFDQLSMQSRLYVSIANLPEILRSTLLLRYFSNFQSYEEIAAILSVPVGTIRSRLNQAKIKLAEHWEQHTDADIKIFKAGEEWNNFYHSTYTGMHQHDDSKNKFIGHLDKDIRIVLTKKKTYTGRSLFENIVGEDRRVGSWLEPVNVLSCGNISVVELKHFNSPEHPGHCPPASVTVLYRDKGKVNQMNLHPSVQ